MSFQCHFCETNFRKKAILNQHIKSVHERKKPFDFEKCLKTFKTHSLLTVHNDSVNEQKRLSFDLSTDISTLETSLIRYNVDKHNVEKEFQCYICNMTFSQKYKMKVHVKTLHEEKKPFNCKICSAKFISNRNLKYHVSYVHEKKKPFKCDICDISFTVESRKKPMFYQSMKEENHLNVTHVLLILYIRQI